MNKKSLDLLDDKISNLLGDRSIEGVNIDDIALRMIYVGTLVAIHNGKLSEAQQIFDEVFLSKMAELEKAIKEKHRK